MERKKSRQNPCDVQARIACCGPGGTRQEEPMQTLATRKTGLLLAAAGGVALTLSAAPGQAQAQQAGREAFKAPTTGTYKQTTSPVRDHRQPGCTGSGGTCVTTTPGSPKREPPGFYAGP